MPIFNNASIMFLGEVPLDLTEKSFLSMDWKNNDKFPGYVLVQTKDMVHISFVVTCVAVLTMHRSAKF